MSVGSFTSVSLDPPLVAFCPARTSTSWPRIRTAGSFCVNLLTARQETVCRAFASQAEDKFVGLRWQPSPATGSPLFDGVAAWIDCEIAEVISAGDHFIVLGAVLDLDHADPDLPLIFHRGGYGRFTPDRS
jgi:flavin reductase (DIM6/NTAB) family NADH-FMN oxidoreductase RutF